MTTTASTVEIESYYEGVRTALADLPPETRKDLLDDLADHLAEVAAEQGPGGLIARLGEPAEYARELRAAAGLDQSSTAARRTFDPAVSMARISARTRHFDRRLGALIGYSRASELLAALRPGWWVVRGWIAAQVVSGAYAYGRWHGFVPEPGGSPVTGLALLIVMVLASVALGRRSPSWTIWPRRMVSAAGVVLIGFALVLAQRATEVQDITYGTTGEVAYDPSTSFNDLWVYGPDGKLIDGARLYDQNGNPVQLGSGECRIGQARVLDNGSGLPTYLYPLCPRDSNPFGGTASTPLVPSGSPSFTDGPTSPTPLISPSITSSVSSPTKPSVKPSVTPTPTPSRTRP